MDNLLCKVFGHKPNNKSIIHTGLQSPIFYVFFTCERCGKTIFIRNDKWYDMRYFFGKVR